MAKATEENPSHLVLGARAFVGKVPARSRFGNKVTAGLFRLVTGQKVTDTQTGLRGMSTDLIPWLLNLDGNRFEYEFNMLLEAKSQATKSLKSLSKPFIWRKIKVRTFAPFVIPSVFTALFKVLWHGRLGLSH